MGVYDPRSKIIHLSKEGHPICCPIEFGCKNYKLTENEDEITCARCLELIGKAPFQGK